MTHLLVAIDDSEYAGKVVQFAGRTAADLNAEITVFHLLAQGPAARGPAEDTESSDRARQIVSEATAQLTALGVRQVNGRVDKGLSGAEATAILDVASELGIEIIVLGHRGNSQLAGLLVGSVAHKVIGLSDRPVLVVR
jgi:nucleotide-binding universal stress UspA family protein